MQGGAAVQAAPIGPGEAFERFGNSEKAGTQMESQAEQPDTELAAFAHEVEAELPDGDGLVGLAEARADYLLERIARERARQDRIHGAAALRVKMIRDNEADECGKVERRIAYLESQVRVQLPGDAGRFKAVYGKKSVSLPHGQIGFKQHRATVEIVDPAKALAFAQAHGLEIRVTQSVNKTPLIEHVMRNSEDPNPETDGFEFVPARDEFFCSPALEV